MNDQELKSLEELHLCPASLHHASAAVLPETTSDSLDKHTATFGNCTKRHSSCSPSQFHEPTHKRAALYPTSSACATDAADHPFHGFTKLQLPHSFTTASPPPLRRTLSDPIYPPSAVRFSAPVPQMPEFPNMNLVQDSTQFPNAARVLQLTDPDPNSVFNHQAAAEAGITPLRPPAGRIASRSPSCGESPSSKRLKRIGEKLKEIRQMCAQVEGEDDEDNNEPDSSFNDNNLKVSIMFQEESENQVEVPSQEAVWVEKIGSILDLHFKCPCGKGYQILLSGKNCYYKLTNF